MMIEGFASWLRSLNYSPATVERYSQLARAFVAAAGDPRADPRGAVERFLSRLSAEGACGNTLRFAYYAIKTLYRYLGLPWPFDRREAPRPSRPRAPAPTMDEVMRVVRAAEASGNLRDAAIIRLAAALGCRRSELAAMNRDDFDPVNMRVRVPSAKGEEPVWRPVDPRTAELLQAYLSSRRDRSPAMFVGRGGRRLTPAELSIIARKYFRAAGLPYAGFHCFRRALTTELFRRGLRERELQEAMRWRSATMPARYIHLMAGEVERKYIEAHPLFGGQP